MRILIVDDDDICRQMLRDTLTNLVSREDLHFATDGDQAWWVITDPELTFDLIIVDLAMPRINGLQLIRRIRQHPKFGQLRIMLCTGTSTRETVAEAAKLGVFSYVVKPFSLTSLIQKIRDLQETKAA